MASTTTFQAKNKFGLQVEHEPDPNVLDGHPHTATITIQPGSANDIPAHTHRSPIAETYEWASGGTLVVLRRAPNEVEWEPVALNEGNRVVGIPPYWPHGAYVRGEKAVAFVAYSRADHFRENTYPLPEDQQPPILRFRRTGRK